MQYRLVKALVGRHAEPLRRRRRRPEHLPLARRRRPEHPRLPARLPRRHGRQARAELPLDRAHRQCRARRHRARARRASRRSSGPRTTRARPSRSSRRATSATRPRSSSTRSTSDARGRRRPAGDGGLLPRARAVARPRRGAPAANACPTRSSAACKFYERAEIKDALAYLRVHRRTRRATSTSCASSTRPARGIGDTTVEQLVATRGRARTSSLLRRARPRSPSRRARSAARREERGLTAFHDLLQRAHARGATGARRAILPSTSSSRPATSKMLEEDDSVEAERGSRTSRELVGLDPRLRGRGGRRRRRRRRSTATSSA